MEFNDRLLDLFLFIAPFPIDIPNLLASIWTKAWTFVRAIATFLFCEQIKKIIGGRR